MLTHGQWAVLGPLVEACRPLTKMAPQNLRQTMDAILWRHQNGAKWRAVPEVLGPWWKAAQTFIRWSRLGVWERLLALMQKDRVELGMTFLDGTNRTTSCLMPFRCWTSCRTCRNGWSPTGATAATPFGSMSGAWAHVR